MKPNLKLIPRTSKPAVEPMKPVPQGARVSQPTYNKIEKLLVDPEHPELGFKDKINPKDFSEAELDEIGDMVDYFYFGEYEDNTSPEEFAQGMVNMFANLKHGQKAQMFPYDLSLDSYPIYLAQLLRKANAGEVKLKKGKLKPPTKAQIDDAIFYTDEYQGALKKAQLAGKDDSYVLSNNWAKIEGQKARMTDHVWQKGERGVKTKQEKIKRINSLLQEINDKYNLGLGRIEDDEFWATQPGSFLPMIEAIAYKQGNKIKLIPRKP